MDFIRVRLVFGCFGKEFHARRHGRRQNHGWQIISGTSALAQPWVRILSFANHDSSIRRSTTDAPHRTPNRGKESQRWTLCGLAAWREFDSFHLSVWWRLRQSSDFADFVTAVKGWRAIAARSKTRCQKWGDSTLLDLGLANHSVPECLIHRAKKTSAKAVLLGVGLDSDGHKRSRPVELRAGGGTHGTQIDG